MTFSRRQALRAVLLTMLALYFLYLQATGRLFSYINPAYTTFSKVATLGLCLLSLQQSTRIWTVAKTGHSCGCGHNHVHAKKRWRWIGYGLVVLPAVLGFSIAPVPLNASIAANKANPTTLAHSNAIINNNYMSEQGYDEAIAALKNNEAINIQAEMFAPYYEMISSEPEAFQSKTITLEGFVHNQANGTRTINRFLITHCVADASVLSFFIHGEMTQSLKDNEWVQLEGTIEHRSGRAVIRVTAIDQLPTPTQPYVYPVLTQIVVNETPDE
ncbi:TIGR03943 family putative permease subunit [Aureibacillus halotolerans]|uniref:Putative membrane protein n=1 Tax=Aureibacillus halotolerans TaxID=1508390 RepID=A0A4R6U617_9BACI|nr:TIGR03943 family protein [Aureibacillus halotolerans]TDQ41206.1 putative membrane protein [Aureibacillus halotolerans]